MQNKILLCIIIATISEGCFENKKNIEINKIDKVMTEASRKLFDAIKKGDMEAAKIAIKDGCNVNEKDSNGETALMLAVELGHTEIVEELLKAGADVKVKNVFGETAFLRAVEKGHIETVNIFLRSGVDVSDLNIGLISASLKGYIEIVRELLRAGADANSKNLFKGRTALMMASAKGHIEVVKALVKAGVDVNAKSRFEDTALSRAIKMHKIAVAYQLIEAGAKVKQSFLDALIKLKDKELKLIYPGIKHKSVPIELFYKYCGYFAEKETIKRQRETDNLVQKYLIKERLGELVFDLVSNMTIVKEKESKLLIDINLLKILYDYIRYLNRKNALTLISQKVKDEEETPVNIIDCLTLREILKRTKSNENEIVEKLIKLKEKSELNISDLKEMKEADIIKTL